MSEIFSGEALSVRAAWRRVGWVFGDDGWGLAFFLHMNHFLPYHGNEDADRERERLFQNRSF